MKYNEAIARLASTDFQLLPGDIAHQKLSPAHRKPAIEYLKEATNYKVAAVLALVQLLL